MANVIIEDSNLTNIANAIRAKNGTTNTYKPSEMPDAITNLPSGGGGLTATQLYELLSAIVGDTRFNTTYMDSKIKVKDNYLMAQNFCLSNTANDTNGFVGVSTANMFMNLTGRKMIFCLVCELGYQYGTGIIVPSDYVEGTDFSITGSGTLTRRSKATPKGHNFEIIHSNVYNSGNSIVWNANGITMEGSTLSYNRPMLFPRNQDITYLRMGIIADYLLFDERD